MRETVLNTFTSLFGKAPTLLVRAPGRANLIGEHTDYNDGFVMPLAIDRALWLAAALRDDSTLRVHSLDYGGESASFPLDQIGDPALPHWTGHIRAGWRLLRGKGLPLPGADIVLGSDIPIGAGLSSSAAIGVAVVNAALALAGEKPASPADVPLLAVEMEHRFLGVPCGVMDQMASALSVPGAAMLLDCRSLAYEPVTLPGTIRVLVMNTNRPRVLADSAYAERRAQCEEAARLLGVPALRDATVEMIEESAAALGDVLTRRARHVVTENARALAMRDALQAADLDRAAALLDASHASLRDDYEVSCLELDAISDLARRQVGSHGARMMGGGFGGSAVALVDADAVDRLAEVVGPLYTRHTGLVAEFTVCQPAAGSSVEHL